MRRVREAVSLGLNVLDADYDKLDVDVANSDSDDEAASATVTKTPVMFERKVYQLTVKTVDVKMHCCHWLGATCIMWLCV